MKTIINRKLSRNKRLALLTTLLLAAALLLATPLTAAEKWPGVDEVVVEKIAAEHGRAASGPLIDTDQGDLLLFMFLVAGAVAGFAAGYSWKALMNFRVMPEGKENG